MECPSPLSLPDPKSNSNADRITVPCGKCGACKYNKRVDKTFRLKEELKTARNGWFLTFTYDEDHLPISKDGIPTLKRVHWTNFVKRLRKRIRKVWPDESFRYYTVGEYGTKTERPHYHSIAYNIPLNIVTDLVNIWELGNVDIGDVEDASLHYVTKHHVNKRENSDEFIDQQTGQVFYRAEEFVTQSTGNGLKWNPSKSKYTRDGTGKPHKYAYGLGWHYIRNNAEWHRENENYFVINNGFKQRLPRYYRDKIFAPTTRKAHYIRNLPELDKQYNREIERLKKLKIKNPESYILQSHAEQAKKVKHKATEGNTF